MKSIQFKMHKLLGYRIVVPSAKLGNKKSDSLGQNAIGPKLGNKR